jgi:PAS domain S-box-containing protein
MIEAVRFAREVKEGRESGRGRELRRLLVGPVLGMVCVAILASVVVLLEWAEQEETRQYASALERLRMIAHLQRDLSEVEAAQHGRVRTGNPLYAEEANAAGHRWEKLSSELSRELSAAQRETLQRARMVVAELRGLAVNEDAVRNVGEVASAARAELERLQRDVEAKMLDQWPPQSRALHSMRVLAYLPRVERLMVEMRMSHRGFVLTGDEAYLSAFYRASGDWVVSLDDLRSMVAHDSEQLGRIERLNSDVKLWREGSVKLDIVAVRVADEPAVRLDQGGGMETLARALSTLAAIRNCEETLRDEMQAEVQANRTHRLALIATACVAALALLGIAGWYGVASSQAQMNRILDAEAKARDSEERFRRFMDNSPAVAFVKDGDGRYVYINAAYRRYFNQRDEDVIGKFDRDLFPADVAEQNLRHDEEVVKRNQAIEVIEVEPIMGGRRLDWLVFKFPIEDAMGRRGVGGVAVDITERRKAEEALAAERERLGVTLRSIGEGVIATDTHGQVVSCNPVAEMLTGWRQEEALGKPVVDILRVREMTRDATNPGGMVMKRSDGGELQISHTVAPIQAHDGKVYGQVIVFRDITKELEREEERRRAEKLESIGILAGGIAHDFNNILTGILGNLSVARDGLPSESSLYQRLFDAERASLRARDLAQQLLTFSKGGAPVRRTASLGDLVRETAAFFLRGSNTRPAFDIPKDLWPVEVDAGQISQVVENLVVNADHAMPEGGCVYIRGRNLSNEAGRCVEIEFRDEGIGIAKENLSKIFDPYFTTKERGTGLGLATVYSIIRKHDGAIAVESEPGHGATFRIRLPASPKSHAICAEEVSSPANAPGPGRGNRVLVLDDEEMIRELVPRMLEPKGFEVICVDDGEAAIAAYAMALAEGRPFAAVILDLTIPGSLGGQEVMRRIIEMDPKARGIVSSGYATNPVMAHFAEYGFKAVVAKPYRVDDLRQIVAETIRG